MTRCCAYCGRQGVRAFQKVQLAGTRTGYVCRGRIACEKRRTAWNNRFRRYASDTYAPALPPSLFEQLSIR